MGRDQKVNIHLLLYFMHTVKSVMEKHFTASNCKECFGEK